MQYVENNVMNWCKKNVGKYDSVQAKEAYMENRDTAPLIPYFVLS